MNDNPPRARTTDPDTSHDAAASVKNRPTLRHRILTLLEHHGPMTDEEIVAHLSPHGSPSGIRTRRAELVDDKQVQRHNVDSITSSGRRCAMWELTPPLSNTPPPPHPAPDLEQDDDNQPPPPPPVAPAWATAKLAQDRARAQERG